jgi:hypothetical protein
MDSQEDSSVQDRIYCGEVVLWREYPARELEPPATCRLGADIGDGWSPGKVTGQKNS